MFSLSSSEGETDPLRNSMALSDGSQTSYATFDNEIPVLRTYKRRYYVAFFFSLMAALQLLLWNTWGPISQSALAAFPGWFPSTIALITNSSNMTMAVFMLPMVYVVHRYGIRYSSLLAAFIMVFGTCLRTYSVDSPIFKIMCYICSVLLGIVSTITLSASPLIASAWFPPHERTTATALCIAITQLGMTASYLEPFLVRSPDVDISTEDIKEDIQRLMFYGAISSICVFLCILVWFPSHPPTPPSITSTTKKLEFSVSFRAMYRNKNFLKILATYAMQFGVINSWMTVMTFSLLIFSLKQDEIKLIGTVSIFISSGVILFFGLITDRFYGHLKNAIIVLNTLTLASFIWILLMTVDFIKFERWQIYTSVIIGLSANYGCWPLYLEMGVESSYPINEAVVGGVLTLAMIIVSSLFLILFSIHNQDFSWVIFVLVGSILISSILLQFIEEDYTRTLIDEQMTKSSDVKLSIPPSKLDDVEELLKGVHERSRTFQDVSLSFN